MTTIAVVGAAGRVGGEIVRGAPARGDAVTALVGDLDEARRAYGEPDGMHVRPTRLDDPRDVAEAFSPGSAQLDRLDPYSPAAGNHKTWGGSHCVFGMSSSFQRRPDSMTPTR